MTTEVPAPPEEAPVPSSSYPLRLTVPVPEASSRLLNFPLFIGTMIRAFLLIPHYIALFFVGIAAALVYFLATFAILFTGRFPRGMHSFVAGSQRWSTNYSAYLFGLVDRYPPFSTEQQDYGVVYEADHAETSNRILNFPVFGLYIKGLLLLPHIFVLAALMFIGVVLLFVAQFAVLFSGSFPAGMHGFITGITRWGARVNGYTMGLTDRYPPFSLG